MFLPVMMTHGAMLCNPQIIYLTSYNLKSSNNVTSRTQDIYDYIKLPTNICNPISR